MYSYSYIDNCLVTVVNMDMTCIPFHLFVCYTHTQTHVNNFFVVTPGNNHIFYLTIYNDNYYKKIIINQIYIYIYIYNDIGNWKQKIKMLMNKKKCPRLCLCIIIDNRLR